MFNYSSKELWELYRVLPEDLKQAGFSEKNTEKISSICQRYNLTEEQENKIIKIIGYVFFGLIPPNQLTDLFIKETKIKPEIAEKIYIEINAFVFFKVKDSLENLYNIKIKKPIQEKKEEKKTDIYRESIE